MRSHLRSVLIILVLGIVVRVTATMPADPDSLQALLAAHSEEDTTRYSYLIALSMAYERSDPEQAAHFALEALAFAEKTKDTARIAQAALSAGNAYETLGSNLRKREYYLLALESARAVGEKKLEVRLLNNLGIVHFQEQNVDIARKYYEKSLDLREEIGYWDGAEATYANLANLYSWERNREKALEYYEKAMAVVKKKGDPLIESIILANIASTHDMALDFEKSRPIFHECRLLKRSLNDLYGLSELYYNLGNSFYKSKEMDSAIFYLDESLALADSIAAEDMQLLAVRDLFRIYREQGRNGVAVKYAERSLTLMDTLLEEETQSIADATEMRFKAEQKVQEREFAAQAEAMAQDARIRNQRIVLYAALACLVLILILLFVIYSRFRERRRTASILEDKVKARTAALSQANKRLAEEMLESDRTQKDLNTYIYRSSHDLKSPLTSIKGLVDIVQTSLGEHDAMQYMGLIGNRVEHLDAILEHLIEQVDLLRRIPEPEDFTVGEIYEAALDDVRGVEGFDKVKFKLSTDPDMPLRSDREYMRVVIRCLLKNSIDYRREEAGECWCELFCKDNETEWEITVTDNGIGMDSDIKSKAFNMFYRGSVRSKGSGMGLYTVRKCLEILRGDVLLASEPEVGTRITMVIPDFVRTQLDKIDEVVKM